MPRSPVVLALFVLALFGCARVTPPNGDPPPMVHAAQAPSPGAVPGAQVAGPEAYWKFVNTEGQKQTYGYTLSQTALLGTVTFGVQGSASKIVKVTHLGVGPCTATSLGIQSVQFKIFKGFTTTDGAAYFATQAYGYGIDAGSSSTAQAVIFLSTPNGLALMASLRSQQLISFPAATLTAAPNLVTFDFCRGPEFCPTVVGLDEIAVLQVAAGGALSGQKCDLDVAWTEE